MAKFVILEEAEPASSPPGPKLGRVRFIWFMVGVITAIGILAWLNRQKIPPFPWGFSPGGDDRPAGDFAIAVAEINGKLTRWRVTPSRLTFYRNSLAAPLRQTRQMQLRPPTAPCSDQPQAQFVISLGPTYLFNSQEYLLETGSDTSALAVELCSWLETVYDEKDPVLEALRKLPGNISVRIYGPIAYEVKVAELAELIYATSRLSRLRSDCVEILVKGYADGQQGPWEQPLHAFPYNYQTIFVYPKAPQNSLNSLAYLRNPTHFFVPPYYNNSHLPNLRARFIQWDVIEPLLTSCSTPQQVRTHVLDGDEFTHWDPQERKVEVYVLFF